MRTIIAGTRHIKDCPANREILCKVIDLSGFTITEVVSGCAEGPDTMGEYWANNVGRVPIKPFKAQWSLHGRAAGPLRNNEMRDYSDALIALWDGKSAGTRHMINAARKKFMPVFVAIIQHGHIVMTSR